MLKSNQIALQVFKDGEWQFVFCFNTHDMKNGPIITTKDRRKALGAMANIEFFRNHFGNYEFRAK